MNPETSIKQPLPKLFIAAILAPIAEGVVCILYVTAGQLTLPGTGGKTIGDFALVFHLPGLTLLAYLRQVPMILLPFAALLVGTLQFFVLIWLATILYAKATAKTCPQ